MHGKQQSRNQGNGGVFQQRQVGMKLLQNATAQEIQSQHAHEVQQDLRQVPRPRVVSADGVVDGMGNLQHRPVVRVGRQAGEGAAVEKILRNELQTAYIGVLQQEVTAIERVVVPVVVGEHGKYDRGQHSEVQRNVVAQIEVLHWLAGAMRAQEGKSAKRPRATGSCGRDEERESM